LRIRILFFYLSSVFLFASVMINQKAWIYISLLLLYNIINLNPSSQIFDPENYKSSLHCSFHIVSYWYYGIYIQDNEICFTEYIYIFSNTKNNHLLFHVVKNHNKKDICELNLSLKRQASNYETCSLLTLGVKSAMVIYRQCVCLGDQKKEPHDNISSGQI